MAIEGASQSRGVDRATLTGGEVPLTARVRAQLPQLQPAMRRVGDLVANQPSKVAAMTISTLASEADTSETTVIRFCREMGLGGYSQLRLALATEIGSRNREDTRLEESADISVGDTIADVVEKIAFADVRSVVDTAKAISIEEISEVVGKIVGASRVEIFGVAASGAVAADLQLKLNRIGLVAFAFPDAHLAVASVTLLNEESVAIAFSHSGTTRETVEWLRLARERGATTVAVTNVPGSALTEYADYTLTTVARETTFRSGATGSRLAQLTVVDCLFVAIAQQTFDDSIRALEGTRAAVAGLRERQGRP